MPRNYRTRLILVGPVPIPTPWAGPETESEFWIDVGFDVTGAAFSFTPGLVELRIGGAAPFHATAMTGPGKMVLYMGPRNACNARLLKPAPVPDTSLPVTQPVCFSLGFSVPPPSPDTDFGLTIIGTSGLGQKLVIPVDFHKEYRGIIEGN
jgi:hypothetical protein